MPAIPDNEDAGSIRVLFIHDPDPMVFAQKMADLLAAARRLGHVATVLGTGISALVRLGPIESWAHVSLYEAPAVATRAVAASEAESKVLSRDGEGFAA